MIFDTRALIGNRQQKAKSEHPIKGKEKEEEKKKKKKKKKRKKKKKKKKKEKEKEKETKKKRKRAKKRKTPCAQALAAYTHKATPTRKIQTFMLYCKTLIYRQISSFTSRKLSHSTNAQRHQTTHGNLHPSLPCKHWLLWAETQLCSCSFFFWKDVLIFLIVEKWVPAMSIFFGRGMLSPAATSQTETTEKKIGEKFLGENRPKRNFGPFFDVG